MKRAVELEEFSLQNPGVRVSVNQRKCAYEVSSGSLVFLCRTGADHKTWHPARRGQHQNQELQGSLGATS